MSSRPASSPRIAQLLLLLSCFLGALFSFFTVEHHARAQLGFDTSSAACNINQLLSCDAVLASKFATLFGIPLGSFGVGFYLALLVIGFGASRLQSAVLLSGLRALLIVSGAAVSLLLLVISELYVGSICPYCALTYLVNFVLFCLLCCGKLSNVSWRRELATLLRFSSWSDSLRQRHIVLTLLLSALMFFGALAATLPWAHAYVLLRSEGQSVGPAPEEMAEALQLQKALQAWESAPVEDLQTSAASGVLQEYKKGPAEAPIQIIEYSDFQCPACRYFYPVLEELLAQYPDKVALTFRNFPLDKACNPLMLQPLHQFACQAAEAARCAGEQGQYWQMVEYIFSEPAFEEEHLQSAGFMSIVRAQVEKSGLDLQGFDQCMLSGRQRERVQLDVQSGIALKLKGTPTLFVNGRRVQLLKPAVLKAIFERVLGRG